MNTIERQRPLLVQESEEYWVKKLLRYGLADKLFDLGIELIDAFNSETKEAQRLLAQKQSERLLYLSNNDQENIFTFLVSALALILRRHQNKPFLIATAPKNKAEKNILTHISPVYIGFQNDDNGSFKKFFLNTRKEILNAFKNQNYDFKKVIRKCEVRGLKNIEAPVILTYNEMQSEQVDLPGSLKVEVSYDNQKKCFSFLAKFPSDILDEFLTNRFLDSYMRCLEYISLNPTALLSKYPYLDEIQIQMMTENYLDFPLTEQSVVAIFEQNVKNGPHRIAFVFDDHQVSYLELNNWANRIANYLKEYHEVLKDDMIAVIVEPGILAVASFLAILKLDACYVPIDVEIPNERQRLIMKDANVKSVITISDLMFDLDSSDANLLILDIQMDEIRDQSHEFIILNSLNNLMYAIYTSGSTGAPKGVLVDQQAYLNQLIAEIKRLNISQNDRLLNVFSHGFDVYHFQLFMSLLSGATGVEIPKNKRSDSSAFIQNINRLSITMSAFTASYLDDLPLKDLGEIRTIVVGGEIASTSNISYLLKRKIRVLNYYGLTETACNAIVCDLQLLKSKSFLPIGKPIANTRAYIVDDQNRVVPFGVIGEIAISGRSLALGYLNNPTFTAERFLRLPDHINGEEPLDDSDLIFNRPANTQNKFFNTLFKTGDLGKVMPDGNILFTGRKDRQVKYKGYRIELGEIEIALQKYPGILNVAVVLSESHNQPSILMAYLQCDDPKDKHELFTYLESQLPQYMIPSKFIFLDLMPLTINGKIDYQSLPSLKQIELTENSIPSNQVERKLQEIWMDVLKKDMVGTNSDFFELGGDSLKAIRIVNRIEKELGVLFEVKDVFELQDIRNLAEKVIDLDKSPSVPIVSIEEQDHYPISHSQSRMWIISQIPESSLAYIVCDNFQLNSYISIENLEKSFQAAIRRHETLRTNFHSVSGKPRQKISTKDEISFKLEYLDFCDEKDPYIKIGKVAKEMQTAVFDLAKDILIRSKIVKLKNNKYNLLLSLHHIVCDGWGMEILFKEIIGLYQSFESEQKIELPRQEINYKDYVVWQNQQISSTLVKRHHNFWMEKFADRPDTLELPADFGRPLIKTYKGDIRSTTISGELAKKLEILSIQYKLSPFILLAASVNILLAKFSGEEDIIVGTPVANRDRKELENLVGLIMNIIPLRSEVKSDITFENYLINLKKDILEAYQHQAYPFDLLVENLDLSGDIVRSPLFDIMIRLQNVNEDGDLNDENTNNAETVSSSSNFQTRYDLLFNFVYSGNKLSLAIEYSTDLFSDSTINNLLKFYKTIYATISENQQIKIKDISLLKPSEKEHYETLINGIRQPIAGDITSLFEVIVSRDPDNIAISCGANFYSFGQIDTMTNGLAYYLNQKYKFRENEIVALVMEPSEWFIISILTAFKLGLTYLPIDVSHPKERLQYMLEDSNTKLILCDSEDRIINNQVEECDYEIISLKTIGNLSQPIHKIKSVYNPEEHNAYVMYTSGSTGRPKGVIVSHQNLLNYISWANNYYFQNQMGFDFALLNSISFDASIVPIFSSLTRGDNLLVTDNSKIDRSLLEIFHFSKNVKAVIMTPSHVNLLVNLPCKNTHVNTVILIGEAVTQSHLEILVGLNKEIKVFNAYGPTETTVECSNTELKSGMPVTIGGPMQNTSIYILDNHMNIQPLGVQGQICIGGVGVARGYLNRVELTNEKFIKNPYKPNERLYLSGDKGRWLSDGNIEFRGRIDGQIKWNGHRIELEEVKQVLLNIAGVIDAHADIKNQNEFSFFVGYIVVINNNLPARYYRTEAMKFLPPHMVPSHILIVDEIPLTVSGKVNKRLLPVPEVPAPESASQPQTPTEFKLQEIWSELLENSKISIDDNFFLLGGNSIKAIQHFSRVNEQIGVDIRHSDIFLNPTIRELGELIDSNRSSGSSETLCNIEEQEYYDLSPAQYRFWILNKLQKDRYKHKLIFSITIDGLDTEIFERSLHLLVERHESLRTNILEIDGEPKQRFIEPEKFQLLLIYSDREFNRDLNNHDLYISNEMKFYEFEMVEGSLFKINLLRNSDNEYLMLVALHHIIGDGTSLDIILKDLAHFYGLQKSGKDDDRDELNIQYKDFTGWVNKKLLKNNFQEAPNYWISKLNGANWNPSLPVDFKKSEIESSIVRNQIVEINQDVKSDLIQLGQKHKGSLFMVITAILKSTLYAFSGETDLLVGTPISCRDHIDLENQVGNFLNTLALRTKFSTSDNFEQLLQSVINTTTEAYQYKNYPFENIIKKLEMPINSDNSSLFRIWVVMQTANEFDSKRTGLENINLQISSGIESQVAKYDLRIAINDSSWGLKINIQYPEELFKNETIIQLVETMNLLVEKVISNPLIPLKELKMTRSIKSAGLQPLAIGKRKTKRNVAIQNVSVKKHFLPGMPKFPIVISSDEEGVDLAMLVENMKTEIHDDLNCYGAVLFRGFNIKTIDKFQEVVMKFDSNLLNYDFASTPRTALKDKVYTSTEYPSNQEIVLHNEMSYTKNWPERLWFLCEEPAREGGETTLADSRKITEDLDPKILELFSKNKLSYIRNFREDLGLSWQKAFNTKDKDQVIAYCENNGIKYEWFDENYLRTSELREAFVTHPFDKKITWFNQAHLFHSSNLSEELRSTLGMIYSEIEMPRNCFYGNGNQIEGSILNQVRDVYLKHEKLLIWERGDVLLVDNLRIAHGRKPYSGNRKLLVVMTI